jgi:hypothetical protein
VCGVIARNRAGETGSRSNPIIIGGPGNTAPTGGGEAAAPAPVSGALADPARQPTRTARCRAAAPRRLAAGLAVKGRAARIGAVLKARGYRARFEAPCAGRLEVRWYRQPRNGARPLLVARAAKTLEVAAVARVKLKLTARGRGLLRRARRVRLLALGRFTPRQGRAISASRAFALRR